MAAWHSSHRERTDLRNYWYLPIVMFFGYHRNNITSQYLQQYVSCATPRVLGTIDGVFQYVDTETGGYPTFFNHGVPLIP